MVRLPVPENCKYYTGPGVFYREVRDAQGVYLEQVDRIPEGVRPAGSVRDCGTHLEIKETTRKETSNG